MGGEAGWYQDDSSVRNTCLPTRGLRGVWGHAPSLKNFEFRSSQIASGTIWDKIVV